MGRKKKTETEAAPVVEKKVAKKRVSKKNGNGTAVKVTGRVTNAVRVLKAWEAVSESWPPVLGSKVRMFKPKDFRGKVAKVIASDFATSSTKVRTAPPGKIRVKCNTEYFTVTQSDVIPHSYKVKDVLAYP